MSNLNWIIAAVGSDAARVRHAGRTCLHLCAQLSADGTFAPLSHPAVAHGDYLGIMDSGGVPRSPDSFAAQAVQAALSRGYAGLMADFERPLLQEQTRALDRAAAQHTLPLLVPLALAEYAPHARIIAETAISGGSLETRFAQLMERFGADRIAAQLRCCCSDFPLPCSDPSGTPLTPDEFDGLLQRTGSGIFFSRELCAKYFTYTQHDQAHFVLFDDADTLYAKTQILQRLGIDTMLAVFPDAERIGLISSN